MPAWSRSDRRRFSASALSPPACCERAYNVPFIVALAAAALAGAIVGTLVALLSLRLRVLYVAVTTLVLHFAVVTLFSFVQAVFLDSTGIILSIPQIWAVRAGHADPLVLFPAGGGGGRGARRIQSVAQLRRPPLDRCRRTRRRRRGARRVGHLRKGIGVRGHLRGRFDSPARCRPIMSGPSPSRATISRLAISYLAMIIVGGVGSVIGSVLGAVLITLLPHVLDQVLLALQFPVRANVLAGIHQTVFGLLIVAVPPVRAARPCRGVASRACRPPPTGRSVIAARSGGPR